MPHIAWDERLNLGIAELDAQHKLLLGHANRLIEGMDKGVAEAMVADLVQKLREYTVLHFREEEAYMARIHYPELVAHRQAHGELRSEVKDLQRQLYEHRIPAPATVRDLLKTWLVEHILHEDYKIGQWLRERQAVGGGEGESRAAKVQPDCPGKLPFI